MIRPKWQFPGKTLVRGLGGLCVLALAGVMEAVCSVRRLARLASRSSPETELPGREGSVA